MILYLLFRNLVFVGVPRTFFIGGGREGETLECGLAARGRPVRFGSGEEAPRIDRLSHWAVCVYSARTVTRSTSRSRRRVGFTPRRKTPRWDTERRSSVVWRTSSSSLGGDALDMSKLAQKVSLCLAGHLCHEEEPLRVLQELTLDREDNLKLGEGEASLERDDRL